MQALDLRTLPIGVPLPRFTEDRFNGPEHRDINDYMPIVPHIPSDPGAYYAKDDAYLTNPTDAGLIDLVKRQATETNDGGCAATNSVPKSPNSNCPIYDTSTTWLIRNVNEPKRGSVLVAAHLLRQELLVPGSFLARGRSPFPGSGDGAQSDVPCRFGERRAALLRLRIRPFARRRSRHRHMNASRVPTLAPARVSPTQLGRGWLLAWFRRRGRRRRGSCGRLG